MVFWALLLVISGSITFVPGPTTGEGGICTDGATPITSSKTERWPLVLLGIFGAAPFTATA
jgi:hypothetical protein